MSYITADRVKETTIIVGTGTVSLLGTSTGFRTFASQMTVGDTCSYIISNASGSEWESGIATYSAANTLTRTSINSSSNSNNAVVFTGGVKDVFMGPTASAVLDRNASIYELGSPKSDDDYVFITPPFPENPTRLGASLYIQAGWSNADGDYSIKGGDLVLSAGSQFGGIRTQDNEGRVIIEGRGGNFLQWQYGDDYVQGYIDYNGSFSLNPYDTRAGSTNEIRFVELASNGTNYVGFKAPDSIASNRIWTLPSGDGSANQGLITNGSGVLSWATNTGTGSNVLANTPTLVTPQTNAINAVPVVSGAGNNLILTAGSGVTSGAGGSLILQAGVQATTGGDGKVVVKQVAGQTSNLQEWQNSSGTVLAKVSKDGYITSPVIYSQIGGGFFIPTELQGIYFENGTTQIKCYNGYIRFFNAGGSTGSIYIDPGSNGYTGYVSLDASNTFAQRNGTNAQAFRVYNTYTDASNYERLGITWASNVCTISTQNAGTGTLRGLTLTSAQTNVDVTGTGTVVFSKGGTTLVTINNGGYGIILTNGYGLQSGSDIRLGDTSARRFIYWPNSIGLGDDSAGVLAQRSGTTAQTFRLYNTYTDASNYERLGITWASNICTIGLEQAGTGSTRNIVLAGANATSGAGGNVTITAGNGSGVGAGGNIILQPGDQGTSGGRGIVYIKAGGAQTTGFYSDPTQVNNLYVTSGTNFISAGGNGNLSGWYGVSAVYFNVTGYTYIRANANSLGMNNAANTEGLSLSFKQATTNISANTNDLVLSTTAFKRFNCTVACSLTGIAPVSGSHEDGRMIRIYNVGTANLTLAHNSTASTTPANRFWNSTGADIILAPNDYAELIYDATSNGSGAAGWRVS